MCCLKAQLHVQCQPCIYAFTGDELRILPKKLQKALAAALKLKDDGMNKQRNALTSEAFLRMFIETVGHYTEFFGTQQNGEQVRVRVGQGPVRVIIIICRSFT